MTYEPWKKDEYLVRFEHIMDKTDDPLLSLPQTFNISEIFPGDFQFTEMNLAANQRIEDMNRLHFKQEGGQRSIGDVDSVPSKTAKALSGAELAITVNPMQIRTFIMSPTEAPTQAPTLPTQAPTIPTQAQSQSPTPAPTDAPSLGVISQNVFKLFPLLILAMILNSFM